MEERPPKSPSDETRALSRPRPAGPQAPPAAVAGFELRDEIGRGGMGVVYRAWQPELKRHVALKVMREGALATRHARDVFRFEAELAASLQHPGIVTIHGAGEADGLAWCAMELVEGHRLDRLVERQGPFEPARAARLVARLARAVQHAHDRGIVHRDLKPGNVLVNERDEPRVLDFGVARRLRDEGADVPPEGTPAFMAPEQAAGSPLASRPGVDIHALGAMLYFLLTGQAPYGATSAGEAMVRAMQGERPPLRSLRRDAPRSLDAACSKALERLPQRRYASARDLAEDLEAFVAGEPVTAASAGLVATWRRWASRHPMLLVTWLALALFYANHLLAWARDRSPEADAYHRTATLTLAAWAVGAWILQSRTERGRHREAWRACWLAADVAFVTWLAWQADGPSSSIVVAYPVIVASTAVRFRRRLVWMALGSSLVGYAALVVHAVLRRPEMAPTSAHAGALACALLITAAVADECVRRMRGLAGLSGR